MKKIFAMAAFVFGILILQMPQADAEDVYVGEWEGGWKAYVVGDSISWDVKRLNYIIFYCTIKGVSPQGTVKYFDYVFTPINENNKLVGASFRDSSGATGKFYVNNPGVYQVEYNAFQGMLMLYREKLNQAREKVNQAGY